MSDYSSFSWRKICGGLGNASMRDLCRTTREQTLHNKLQHHTRIGISLKKTQLCISFQQTTLKTRQRMRGGELWIGLGCHD